MYRVVLCGMLIGLLCTGCAGSKPECPDIPIYPGAQRIGFEERQSARRISIYQSSATTDAVIQYYRSALVDRGWELRDTPPQRFEALYTTPRRPPLLLELAFQTTSERATRYEVHVTISGPYAGFETWCTMVNR